MLVFLIMKGLPSNVWLSFYDKKERGMTIKKERLLFFLYGLYILLLASYLYYLLALKLTELLDLSTSIFDIIWIALYFITVFPLSFFLANRLTDFSLRRNFAGKPLLAVLLIFPILLGSLNFGLAYKEKNLDQVLHYDVKSFNRLTLQAINQEGTSYDFLETSEADLARKIDGFLASYRVKKMKNREWDSDVSKEKGFELAVYKGGKAEVMASIYEDRVLLYSNGNAYRVLNGPINFSELEAQLEE